MCPTLLKQDATGCRPVGATDVPWGVVIWTPRTM